MKYNLLFDVDSYKASHYLQYPENTESVFSYIEARGGKYKDTVFFGVIIYILKDINYLFVTGTLSSCPFLSYKPSCFQ